MIRRLAYTTLTVAGLIGGSVIAPGWADDANLRSEYAGATLPPATTARPTTITSAVAVLQQAVPAETRPAPTTPHTTTTTTTLPPGPPVPVDGDCDTWRPLLDYYELPWDLFGPILWRESRCTNAHAVDSDDHSHGGLQVNRIGRNLSAAWDSLGFDHDYMHTTTGAIHAAGVLYQRCGFGPWSYDYACGFPNGALTRWEWP